MTPCTGSHRETCTTEAVNHLLCPGGGAGLSPWTDASSARVSTSANQRKYCNHTKNKLNG